MFFNRAVLGVHFDPFMDGTRCETNISLGITSSVVALKLVHNVILLQDFSPYCGFVPYDNVRDLSGFIIDAEFNNVIVRNRN